MSFVNHRGLPEGNIFQVTGIVTAFLPLSWFIRLKPGIKGKRGRIFGYRNEEFEVVSSDPGYSVVYCKYFQKAVCTGGAKQVGSGLFVIPHGTSSAKIEFASGTDGYESSIEKGFSIGVDGRKLLTAVLPSQRALEIVDCRLSKASA